MPFHRRPVERRRAGRNDHVREAIDADQCVAEPTTTGNIVRVVDAFVDRLDGLVRRDLAAFEVALEKLVVDSATESSRSV